MDLGINIKDLVISTRRESITKKDESEEVCTGEILGGRRRSILQVAGAVRTGVRLGSITKQTALNSKLLLPTFFGMQIYTTHNSNCSAY